MAGGIVGKAVRKSQDRFAEVGGYDTGLVEKWVLRHLA